MKDIIAINNFLNKDEYLKMEYELKELSQYLTYKEIGKFNFYRYSIDQHYIKNREASDILKVFNKKIYNKEMYNLADKIYDLSYRLLKCPHKYITQITSMNGEYGWHYDMYPQNNDIVWTKQFMTWLWYYKPKDTYSEGNLVIPDSNFDEEPTDNRLILLASHKDHMVKPIKPKKDNLELLEQRVTIGGYMTI